MNTEDRHYLQTQENLKVVSDILDSCGVVFWLEAGSALAAYRDGNIFPWEHDVDLATWYDDLDKVMNAVKKFIKKGYKVRIQKGFPYIDNIIQIYAPDFPDGEKPFPDQFDIYIYRKRDDYALMRWIHSPTGLFAKLQKRIIFASNALTYRKYDNKKAYYRVLSLIPFGIRKLLFRIFLGIYIKQGKCIYHIHPVKYFQELKTIDFYGVPFKIPGDTEGFLAHRYGPNWRNPDKSFNASGKWKKMSSRKEMRFSVIEFPPLDFEMQDYYAKLQNSY